MSCKDTRTKIGTKIGGFRKWGFQKLGAFRKWGHSEHGGSDRGGTHDAFCVCATCCVDTCLLVSECERGRERQLDS